MSKIPISLPDGSRLTLLEQGGRVLALHPPGGPNFFWTASALYPGSWNVGGDRTWISPEVDIFVPDFPNTSVFRVPPELDPGNYQFDSDPAPRLAMQCRLTLSRTGMTAEVEIAKSWTTAPDPARREDVGYAGYMQKTELRAGNAPVAVWNIAQLPTGGEVLIPVRGAALPKIYFGSIPPEDLHIASNLIRYRACRPGLAKFGVYPQSATGRIGYLWESEGAANLVIRSIIVKPELKYGDIAWLGVRDLELQGCALQVCSVNNELGAYVELEHHAPVGHSDVSQLHAWRGPISVIRAIATRLLGAPSR